MDPCNLVEKEMDNVFVRLVSIRSQLGSNLDSFIERIECLKHSIENELSETGTISDDKINEMNALLRHIFGDLHKSLTDHREMHCNVSRIGKAIDRNFCSNISTGDGRPQEITSSENLKILNRVVCEHFYRLGMNDIADELVKESGVNCDDFAHETFQELNFIFENLANQNTDPALEWAIGHRAELEKHNSSLEFKLHRLRFISIMKKGPEAQTEAILYARAFFNKFVSLHEEEIQNLMGMFLYLPTGFRNTPYDSFLKQDLWYEICDVFMQDACKMLQMSAESPLSVCIGAGCTALPSLLSLRQAMQQRQISSYINGKDELPIEIDLGPERRYHSVFACPILRQQATSSNPPMKLLCGHVITRDALNKIQNGDKVKCPYCPMEQSISDAKIIYF